MVQSTVRKEGICSTSFLKYIYIYIFENIYIYILKYIYIYCLFVCFWLYWLLGEARGIFVASCGVFPSGCAAFMKASL